MGKQTHQTDPNLTLRFSCSFNELESVQQGSSKTHVVTLPSKSTGKLLSGEYLVIKLKDLHLANSSPLAGVNLPWRL